MLRTQIAELKSFLKDKNAPFGIDLLLPQVGGNARKTNMDYTKGQLPELIDIIIAEKASLFVSAVGIPPKWAVEKLHGAGILCMNMIGHPKHAVKALEVGVDIICAQGGEGGGHTGEVPSSILWAAAVDSVKDKLSPFTGKQVEVVAAGGISDSRGLAMALSAGCSAVWVGTRFIVSKEAGAPPRHQQAVLNANLTDTIRTIIYTGRPMRVLKTEYIDSWENGRPNEIKELTSRGIIPAYDDIEKKKKSGIEMTFQDQLNMTPLLMGKVAGVITGETPSAKEIIDEMVGGAVQILKRNSAMVSKL